MSIDLLLEQFQLRHLRLRNSDKASRRSVGGIAVQRQHVAPLAFPREAEQPLLTKPAIQPVDPISTPSASRSSHPTTTSSDGAWI